MPACSCKFFRLAAALFFAVSLSFSPLSAFAELRNGMDADVVIGQPNFVTNSPGTTQSKTDTLQGVATDGKRLIIADNTNNRELLFNTIPKNSSAPADIVIGQTNFSSNGAGTGAAQLNSPRLAYIDGKRLIIPDFTNNRVLIWNTIPAVNGVQADIAVGQPDLSTTAAGAGLANLSGPIAVASDGRRLFVADALNFRILIWNSIPATNGVPANVLLGETGVAGQGPVRFALPVAVFFDGKNLFVSDFNNNRILIWKSLPAQNQTPADIVLGQPDFNGSAAGTSARHLSTPGQIFSDGRSLYVADLGNNRVLIWKKIPESNFAPADIVLGQPDFTTGTAGLGRNKMDAPTSVASDGQRLFVAEQNNRRLLIFNLGSGSETKLGPHFEQGKSVVGKVFEDRDGDGWQDKDENGIDGVRIFSDTGIYAITDEDGKYHFPFIETGQRVLKVDENTLGEGAVLTTESPRKIVVTKGMLTKVSFGVRLPDYKSFLPQAAGGKKDKDAPLLKIAVSQDASALKPRLSISAEQKKEKAQAADRKIIFTIDCNYFLLIHRAELKLYDGNKKPVQTINLPSPLPLRYEMPLPLGRSAARLWKDKETREDVFYYQLSVFDKRGREDRTGIGRISLQ